MNSQVVLLEKNLPANAGGVRDAGSIPGLVRLEEEMATHSSIPGESHGQRSLEGYSPQGCKELDTSEATLTCMRAMHELKLC